MCVYVCLYVCVYVYDLIVKLVFRKKSCSFLCVRVVSLSHTHAHTFTHSLTHSSHTHSSHQANPKCPVQNARGKGTFISFDMPTTKERDQLIADLRQRGITHTHIHTHDKLTHKTNAHMRIM